MIELLNGSPKAKENNSGYFLSRLQEKLTDQDIHTYRIIEQKSFDAIFEDVLQSDRVVIAFPLYVDSIPSHMVRFFKKLELYLKGRDCKTKIYLMVNCGFYEGRQNHIAIEMVKIFCHKTNLFFGQAIGIGAGEMLGGMGKVPLDAGPNKALGMALANLSNSINDGTASDDLYIQPSHFPRFAYSLAADHSWGKMAKEYGNSKHKLKRRLYKKPKETNKKN